MTTTLIQLTNNFHNTTTVIRCEVRESDLGNGYVIQPSQAQIDRAARKLCPIPGCTCGGIRGPQMHDGRRLSIEQ